MPDLVAQLISAAALLGACFVAFGALGKAFPCNPGRPVFFSGRSGSTSAIACWAPPTPPSARPPRPSSAPSPAPALSPSPAGSPPRRSGCSCRPPRRHRLRAVLDPSRLPRPRALAFHAIHHSAADVNWTTTFRIHPVNYLVANAALALLARLVGFSQAACCSSPRRSSSSRAPGPTPTSTGPSGPLRYVIASPVFHRWHHVADPAAARPQLRADVPGLGPDVRHLLHAAPRPARAVRRRRRAGRPGRPAGPPAAAGLRRRGQPPIRNQRGRPPRRYRV